MDSIVQQRKECYLCRILYGAENVRGLEMHHMIPGTANRKKSEKWKLKVWLCAEHHRTGELAVHRNKCIMDQFKARAQEQFEAEYSHELWMSEFGKNFI